MASKKLSDTIDELKTELKVIESSKTDLKLEIKDKIKEIKNRDNEIKKHEITISENLLTLADYTRQIKGKEQVRELGYNRGYHNGHQDGYDEGFKAGRLSHIR